MDEVAATRGWQPIDNAPKDETGILVWGSFGPNGEDCIIAAWYDRNAINLRHFKHGPWVWALVGADEGSYAESLAKMWMPLPSPPSGG